MAEERASASKSESYAAAAWLFARLMGIVYFFAFYSLFEQAEGLIGPRGILPADKLFERAHEALGARAYLVLPGIFWLSASDAVLSGAALGGALLGLAFAAGFSNRLSALALWLLYLSFVSAGQDFLRFQWDTLLLEGGFLTIFLCPVRPLWKFGEARAPSFVMVCLYRWLLFRLMFMSGVVKLKSGDPAWASLTALSYHYETQPLPTALAWYAHNLPLSVHELSAAGMFVIELFVPFLLFGPRIARALAFVALGLLQILIILTGNYCFFNLLTLGLSLFALDDALLEGAVRRIGRQLGARLTSLAQARARPAEIALAVLIALLSVSAIGALPRPRPLAALDGFNIVNRYGLFAVMTTERNEIELEGSLDGLEWRPIVFPSKPGDVSRMPGWIAPFQPRLDWQMWFAALGPCQASRWFPQLAYRLLEGEPAVTRLFGSFPFETPPRFIRSRFYRYRFTGWRRGHESGDWWEREERGMFCPIIAKR